jgi:hypothetical protein
VAAALEEAAGVVTAMVPLPTSAAGRRGGATGRLPEPEAALAGTRVPPAGLCRAPGRLGMPVARRGAAGEPPPATRGRPGRG